LRDGEAELRKILDVENVTDSFSAEIAAAWSGWARTRLPAHIFSPEPALSCPQPRG
jgi:hypothetical protein